MSVKIYRACMGMSGVFMGLHALAAQFIDKQPLTAALLYIAASVCFIGAKP